MRYFFACIIFRWFWCVLFCAITAPIDIFVVGLAAWIDALLLYGFGKLIEDVSAICASLLYKAKNVKAEPTAPVMPHAPAMHEPALDDQVILN